MVQGKACHVEGQSTHDLVILECEQLFLQTIAVLFYVLLRQKSFDFIVTEDELITITPDAIFGVS